MSVILAQPSHDEMTVAPTFHVPSGACPKPAQMSDAFLVAQFTQSPLPSFLGGGVVKW
jgi:hypothetical protein